MKIRTWILKWLGISATRRDIEANLRKHISDEAMRYLNSDECARNIRSSLLWAHLKDDHYCSNLMVGRAIDMLPDDDRFIKKLIKTLNEYQLRR